MLIIVIIFFYVIFIVIIVILIAVLIIISILALLRLRSNIILKFSALCLLKVLEFGLSWQIIVLKLIIGMFIGKITYVNIVNSLTNIPNLSQIILKLVIKIISLLKFGYILIPSLTI